MALNLLGRFSGKNKSRKKGDDGYEGVDLESGTINIDVKGVEYDTVSTGEVFREDEDDEGAEARRVMADDPSVYIIDLRPFFNAINAEKGGRMAKSLVDTAENMLERRLKGEGVFTNQDDEMLLFRFKNHREDGLRVAVGFVNEIGTHFLRDAYKSEDFVEQVINMTESAEAVDSSGNIDVDNALKYRLIVDRSTEKENLPEWEQSEDGRPATPKDIMELAIEINHRAAKENVERSGDRRQSVVPIEGPDRRKGDRGRRDIDDPAQNVWGSFTRR